MKRFLCHVVALGLLLARVGQATADYLVTTIDAPGSNYTILTGISSSGQIVGYDRGSDSGLHGLLIAGGVFTNFDPPGSGQTLPQGINDLRQLVGSYYPNTSPGQPFPKPIGFLFSGGAYTNIAPPDSTETSAFGINNAGQIVGSYTDASRLSHAFVVSGSSYTMIDVPGSNLDSGSRNQQCRPDLGRLF